MGTSSRTSPFDLSLEVMRRDHPAEYRRWVLVGVFATFFGYTVSCIVFTVQHGLRATFDLADPYVALANLAALGMWARGHTRTAACVPLIGAWLDVHVSLLTLHPPALTVTGLVVPVFVLGAALLLGGRAAFIAAGTLAFSVPGAMWLATRLHTGGGFVEANVVHFVVVLEAVLLTTTALLAAFLFSFAEVLKQHEDAEARTRELQAQLQHAQKLEALGLLAGGIAHDFNNLLTAIGGYGALLGGSTDERAREFGAEIVATQKRGATLTRQLLAFARKDVSQPKPIDLARTLSEMTALLERAVGENVTVQLDCEPECVILADPGRIEQVVLNLVMNSRDAMPDGGRVWIRCAKEEQRVMFEVEDEGVGMDAATQARVFEPFFTTKIRNHGTGLGLSTVHGIVVDSGGSIELHSELGRGTSFVVSWPRAQQAPEPDAIAPVSVAGAERAVLLVEDNDGARAFVQSLLRDRGFRVEAARSAEEALELTQKRNAAPDLVLCDVIMPGLTGPQLVSRLKTRWPGLCCLFMSGYLGDVGLGDGFDAASDLVLKPFTASELLERVARKLDVSCT